MVAPHNYAHFSDTELVDRYRQKPDLDVLGILYKRYMYLVYGVCMKYLKNRDDSQDAVMQIFEMLVDDVSKYEIRNFKSWLYGVSRNFCLMKLRKDISERNRHNRISMDLFMESTTVMHPIEDTTSDGVLQDRLKMCMEQLKEEQRRCVELFYYQQHCYKEIAVEMKLDENKVKSFIQNGKRNLKICIESNAVLKNVGD